MKKSLVTLMVVMLAGLSFPALAQTVDSGTFMANQNTTGYNLHQNTGDREFTVEVKFNKTFESKPQIILSVTGVDAEKGTNLRYEVKSSFASNEGFILKIRTWADSKIYSITGNWLAIAK